MAAQRASSQLRKLSSSTLQRRGCARLRAWTHKQQSCVSTLPATREAKAGGAVLEDHPCPGWSKACRLRRPKRIEHSDICKALPVNEDKEEAEANSEKWAKKAI